MRRIESSEYKTYDINTTTQLLSRLKSDCDYVLNYGGVRNLWGKTIDGHVGAMRFYWNFLKDKPDWLTLADIDDYEMRLKAKFHESVEEKARHLVKIQVFFDGKDAFSFNYEGKVHVFHGDKVQLTKFLQSFKAKDNKTQPRSVRGERYADIAQEIIDQTDNIIYAWSNDLSNATMKKESVEKVNESDEIYLNGKTFKSNGLYAKTAKVYGNIWADQLLKFADDEEAQKAGYYLIANDDLRTMWISNTKKFTQDALFFCDRSGEREGDFIKFGMFGGAFSNSFAKSHAPTFIGMEDGDLVIKSGDSWLHAFEDTDSIFKPITEEAFDTVFVFFDSEVQRMFTYLLDKFKIKYQQLINKVWTFGDIAMSHKEIDSLDEKYQDLIETYTVVEFNALKKRGLIEAVNFTKDGAEITNEDGALLTHLFTQLEGDPRWKVDVAHRRCVRNDGGYFCIKGNMLEAGGRNGKWIAIPWTKEIKFLIMPNGMIGVRFEINAAGPGRFII